MVMTLAVGHCEGMGGGGDFSFHDHSEAGTMDAAVLQQSAHTPNTTAMARGRGRDALPRGITLSSTGGGSGRGMNGRREMQQIVLMCSNCATML
jgi:hypothetical protein